MGERVMDGCRKILSKLKPIVGMKCYSLKSYLTRSLHSNVDAYRM